MAAIGPGELLERLAAEARRARAANALDGLPRVRIDTASGARYVGQVLAAETHVGFQRVLLAEGDPAALVFFDLGGGFQVALLDAAEHARFLRFGQVARWSDVARSALELKRLAARVREQLAGFGLELRVPDAFFGGDALGAVGDLLEVLPARVEAIRADETGRAAFAEVKALALVHEPGRALRVRKNGDAIELSWDPVEGLPNRENVAAAIDAAL